MRGRVEATWRVFAIYSGRSCQKNFVFVREIAKEQQTAVISTARKNYGKMVTIVDGIDDTAIDINQLAKTLKSACASGGTVKGES